MTTDRDREYMLSDEECLDIAREIDPKASGFFRSMLARAAKIGAQRALDQLRDGVPPPGSRLTP